MAEVTMPRLSDTMEEGTIASWLKQPGDEVKKGDVIAQIETDKATMDLTVFEAGTLQEILAPEGATVAIGKPVARIGAGGAAPASADSAQTKAPADSAQAPADGTSAPARTSRTPADTSGASADVPEGSEAADAGAASDADLTAQNAAIAEGATATRDDEVGEGEAATDATSRDGASTAPQATSDRTESARAVDTDAATGSDRASTTQQTAAAPPSDGSDRPTPVAAGPSDETRDAAADGKVRASPLARHLAAEHGLDLSRIEGSGPQGRVVRADVEAVLASPSASAAPAAAPTEAAAPAAGQAPAADDERVPLSQMRRTIARRMAESTRTVPHFFLTTTVDATDLVALRTQIVEHGVKVSFNDVVIKAVAHTLREFPDVNVSFAEDALIRHRHINIGIAVATERGLIVPVLRDADQKTLSQIASDARDLAERAHAGKLQPPDYSGGTFTISNLGMFGVDQFNAVINTPEAAILAVGAITRAPAEHDGVIALRERMMLTLSVDHRALDGAQGARFLQALKAALEKPLLLLV